MYVEQEVKFSRTAGSITIVYLYLGPLYEADNQAANTSPRLYQFGGTVVAQRTINSGGNTFIYLHGDHLGSISMTTDGVSDNHVSGQEFDPWGGIRSGNVPKTKLNYTGQRKDATGLLYYGARYYNPTLGRFISADTIVPGMAMGAGGAMGTLGMDKNTSAKSLTVDYHEPGFAAAVAGENGFTFSKGFWFQLSSQDRQQAKTPYGPLNPQALNRYSYVLNNPLRYSDPMGHSWYLSQQDAQLLVSALTVAAKELKDTGSFNLNDILSLVPLGAVPVNGWGAVVGMLGSLVLNLLSKVTGVIAGAILQSLASAIAANIGPDGVGIMSDTDGIWILNRTTGEVNLWTIGVNGIGWSFVRGAFLTEWIFGTKPLWSANGKDWKQTWHFIEYSYWYYDDPTYCHTPGCTN